MMALQSKSHSSRDLLFGDQDCLVDGFLDQFKSVLIGYDPTGEGIGKSRFLHNFDESAGAQTFHHGRATLHHDADNMDFRVGGLESKGDTTQQAATRQRHDDGVQIGKLLQQFQADGSLSGDDDRVIIGMNHLQPLFFTKAVGLFRRLIVSAAPDDHLGPEFLDRVSLVGGNRIGEANNGPQPETVGDIGQRTAVVAAGDSDDPPPSRPGIQGQEFVGSSPRFERAGLLQVLELESDLAACQFRQRRG